MTESEKNKKKAEVTIFTAKCNAAIDVAKELDTLRIKAERKHCEAEKQYEAFCKRNETHSYQPVQLCGFTSDLPPMTLTISSQGNSYFIYFFL